MTSRGNPSISPPAQIPQQRHGNALQSGTPPPQQYYPGQSPALAGGFEYIATQQPQLLSYQAYGSAVNEVRAQPGNGSRGGPPQQTMHQGGQAFYQQPGATMRPQHQQQGQVNQQYYISGPMQNNIRARAHHQNQSQSMVFIPQTFPGNNVVIAPNMYHQPRPQMNAAYYPTSAVPQSTYPALYIPNGGGPQWQGPRMPSAGQAVARPAREKKIIEIKDPNTGKDLTEELININSAHADHPEAEEEQASNQPSQEIGKLFTRMVVESLNKPSDDSSTSGAVEANQMGSIPQPGPGVPSSQQYQQPPPHMMRPGHPNMGPPRMPPPNMMPPRPGMMQPQQQQGQPPATPPHAEMRVNFSMPPPPLRQPTPAQIYSTAQQHLVRHPQQQQQQPSQAMRPPNVPVISNPQVPVQQPQQQQHHAVQPQPQAQQQQPPAPQPDVVTGPTSTPAAPPATEQPAAAAVPPPKEESAPKPAAEHIPSAVPAAKPPSPPAKEETPPPAPSQPAQKEATPPAEEAAKTLESKEDTPQGASNRGAKDVRKGKKNKRDLNTKEIGGSDMDAFIDSQRNASTSGKAVPLQNGETHQTNGGPVLGQQQQQTSNSLKRDPKNPWNIQLPKLAGQGSGKIQTAESKAAVEKKPLNASNNKTETLSEQLEPSLTVKTVTEPEESASSIASESSPSSSGSLAGNSVLDERNEKSHGDSMAQGDEGVPEKVPKAQESLKESPKLTEGTTQVEPKNKQRKKKKKKGRKSPPIPKSKQSPAEERENETSNSTSKPPLPPAAESRTAADKVASQPEAKPVEPVKEEGNISTAAPAAPEEPKDKESSPAAEEKIPPQEAPTVTPEAEPVPEQKPSEPAAAATEDKKAEDAAEATAGNNQNQTEPEGSSQQQAPAAESASNPQINVVPSESDNRTVSSESKDKAEPAPQTPENDENVPPKELSLRPKTASGEDSTEDPGKSPVEKPGAAVKKDGKDKLQYDRAYLMELRECASSQTKPEGLPNLDIILDRPVNRAASGTSPDFTPNFFQPSTPQRHPQQMGKSASRGRARPGEMQMPQRVIKSVSIQNDVKALHQSEKPWKPSQKQLATGEISNKVENLESKALFILNRLTPTNFGSLSDEMLGLKITDYEQLQQLVKIFFDKVTLETKFVEAYAKLCKKMCTLKVPPPANMKENQATFRVLLLTKCQTEFESDKAIVFEDPEKKKKELAAELPDGPEKAEEIERTLYHMKLRRLKFYGNIRFIGELFKLSMLTENIMHDCIFRLLKARDDESLLSLCQLISTVGSILDTDKAKQRMDQYFVQMVKIAEERKSRIKFTLKDAIELRQNNWVPRKETTGPKKIDEVRQDFHQEQQTKQFLQNQPAPPRSDPQPSSRRGSRQRQEEKPSDDGWNTVGSKSIRIDASKMKFSKNVVDENIQLGPGGGMNKFSMWSRGSGAAAQASQDSPSSRPANRFSALPSEEDRRFQRSPSRGDGGIGSRGLRQGNTAGHGRGKIMGRSSIEGERRDALNSARSIVGGRSQNSSRDNSWNRDDRRSLGPRGSREGESPMGPPRTINLRPSAERGPPPAPAPVVSSQYGNVKRAAPKTEEEMEHTAKTIMDEYLNIRDLKEAKLCMMELEGQKYLYAFITASINNVLERTDKDRSLTGQFFQEILKDNLLSLDKFIKGLGEVLQFAEDMVIDIPKMWTNLAQLITPALVGGCMPWTQLKPTLEPHLSQMCAAKLIAEILLIAKTLVSEAEVVRMWQSSGLTWEAVLPADRVADFIKDKKLEFLQGAAASTSPAPSQANQDRTISDLTKMIKEGKSSADIHSYINSNLSRDMDEKLFVRWLMTAVSKASLSPTNKANAEVIANRQEFLQKYIKTPELELQALYAIQALMHRMEHPGGVIASLFEALLNEEVISEEAFKQWEHSTEEQEGKGPCILQLTQFFAWLRENEDLETS